MNDVLQKVLDFILRRQTVNQIVNQFAVMEARLAQRAQIEGARAEKAKLAAVKALTKAKAAEAEIERADRIAARVRALVD